MISERFRCDVVTISIDPFACACLEQPNAIVTRTLRYRNDITLIAVVRHGVA